MRSARISPINVHDFAQLLTLLLPATGQLKERALQSPRRRAHERVAPGADGANRTLIAMLAGSYVRPHVHDAAQEHDVEILLAIEGETGIVTFDRSGRVASAESIGVGQAYAVSAHVYHTAFPLGNSCIFLEAAVLSAKGYDKRYHDTFPEEFDDRCSLLLESWLQEIARNCEKEF
ncbi:WbuC family cupin fold metalloprotein [Streptomyces sp. NPDC056534]|uniref:WbuC family cupin fold metalloprotein n=1 Tax=Streptomyces sp. NPDC056534 TaxID=3345857 RepID=UPI0036A1C265